MTENIHFTIEGGYQYKAYYDGICFQKSWHRLKYQKALELLDVKEGEVVLDAACGSGIMSNLIAETGASKVIGVDFSEAAISFCKQTYRNRALEFQEQDLTQPAFSTNSFDKVVMLEAVEHMTPAVASSVLNNLYTYLKPGGRLVISTPNKKSLWPVIEFLLDSFRLTPKMKNEQHVKLYSGTSLQKLLENASFEVNCIQASHFVAPWLSFFGLKVAERIHKVENRVRVFPGSLLFAVAEKPIT